MKSATGTPWSVFDHEEHGCKGYLEVVHAEEGQHKVICEVIDHDNDRENAALIATAPDLLIALDDFIRFLERNAPPTAAIIITINSLKNLAMKAKGES